MTASAHRKQRLIVAADTGACAAAPASADRGQRITIVGLVEGSNQTAEATVYDGSADNVSTRDSRREVDPYEYAQPGTFVVAGTVEGTSLQAWATVTVKEEM